MPLKMLNDVVNNNRYCSKAMQYVYRIEIVRFLLHGIYYMRARISHKKPLNPFSAIIWRARAM